jgi:phytoene dehydrogenase-like protein
VVLEQHDVVGGAAVSTKTFEGVEARLSRYSYLVSLLPKQIIEDLNLEVELAPRRYGSFTPTLDGKSGLLIDKSDAAATKASFEEVGAGDDYEAWNKFYGKTELIAQKLFSTVLEPLRNEQEVADLLGPELWSDFFQRPIGETIEKTFKSDLVRGVVMTDAVIGTFSSNQDESLQANKCFLYHVIGNETGDWNIPVGGMGSVTTSMAKRAKELGAELRPSCRVLTIGAGEPHAIRFSEQGAEQSITADVILANVAKPTLDALLGHAGKHNIEGAQVKVNMLLTRLPKLKAGTDPIAAFGGTLHINETFVQLQTAYDQASQGEIPNPLPCEIYCHSITDPSILGPELKASGAQTLTVFALHTPHSLLAGHDHDQMRQALEDAAIESINSVLDEDVRGLLFVDANGKPCIETKTTQDLEDALGLPGGNIFHAPLSWPFASSSAVLDSPAARWGVDSGYQGIFFCGSTAVRGGAVSGIAGHNAAMAVLEG